MQNKPFMISMEHYRPRIMAEVFRSAKTGWKVEMYGHGTKEGEHRLTVADTNNSPVVC